MPSCNRGLSAAPLIHIRRATIVSKDCGDATHEVRRKRRDRKKENQKRRKAGLEVKLRAMSAMDTSVTENQEFGILNSNCTPLLARVFGASDFQNASACPREAVSAFLKPVENFQCHECGMHPYSKASAKRSPDVRSRILGKRNAGNEIKSFAQAVREPQARS